MSRPLVFPRAALSPCRSCYFGARRRRWRGAAGPRPAQTAPAARPRWAWASWRSTGFLLPWQPRCLQQARSRGPLSPMSLFGRQASARVAGLRALGPLGVPGSAFCEVPAGELDSDLLLMMMHHLRISLFPCIYLPLWPYNPGQSKHELHEEASER